MAKTPKWMYYAGAGTVILVAYTFLSAPEAAPKGRANNVFRGGTSTKAKPDELFRPEDYTVKFTPVNVTPKDAFKPLVAKATKTLTTEGTITGPNGIPAAFTGGDANWIYTGNAEVNGVPNALLENTSTQEGVFLRPGERWKSLTLARVTPNQIELIGPTGQRRSVSIAEPTSSESPVASSGSGASGTLPGVTPGGRAPLTGGIGVDPNAAGTQSGAQAGGQTGDNRTNRENRRNRRNNRNSGNNANPAPTFGNP